MAFGVKCNGDTALYPQHPRTRESLHPCPLPMPVAANRRNAQLSTGPRTARARKRSRRNALIHGLTGRALHCPTRMRSKSPRGSRSCRKNCSLAGFRADSTSAGSLTCRSGWSVGERLDTAVYSKRIRHADVDFVDHRMTQVEALASRVAFDRDDRPAAPEYSRGDQTGWSASGPSYAAI